MEGVEICTSPCSIDNGGGRLAAVSACEQKSRAARRRRMEIRRFKLIAMSRVAAAVTTTAAAAAAAATAATVDPASSTRKKHKFADSNNAASVDSFHTGGVVADSVETITETTTGSGAGSTCSCKLEKHGRISPKSGEEEVYEEVEEEEEEEAMMNRLLQNDNNDNSGGNNGNSSSTSCCHGFGVQSICGRRKEMEDAVCVVPPEFNSVKRRCLRGMHFFGVYDGHGGSEAANFCKDRLHEVLAEELDAREEINSEEQWREAFLHCFSRVDAEVLSGGFMCRENCSSSNSRRRDNGDDAAQDCFCGHTIASEAVGTTAVVAVVDHKKIVVANCGDSRAVLCRAGRAIPLSQDHKPDRADEMARIEAAGGHVIFWDGPRVSGVLAMSRAIGDKYLKPYVISEPEVTVTARSKEDECLILASDGVWDVLSNETVCEVARRCLRSRTQQWQKQCQWLPSSANANTNNNARNAMESSPESVASATAALLTQLALAKGSHDNISVVVVDLRNRSGNKRRSNNSNMKV